MKKGLLFAKVLVLSLAVVFSLAACGGEKQNELKEGQTETEQGTGTENEDKAAQDESDSPLIVGTEAGFPPFEYVGENGEVVGVDIEIAQAIADKLGKKLEIKNMSFDGALLEVQNGKVDMVAAGVTITEERKETMDFSEPYFENAQVIVVNVANPAVTETSAEALKDKIVGAQFGTTGDLWASEECEAKEVKTYKQLAVAVMDLQQNKLDAIVMDLVVAKEMIASTGDSIKILDGEPVVKEETALVFPKGSELLSVADEVIAELKASGKIDEFFKKHQTAE